MSVFVNPLKSSKTKFKEAIALQIYNHKKTAAHLEAAAQSHKEAAKHHEDGNHELAALTSIEANTQMELVKAFSLK